MFMTKKERLLLSTMALARVFNLILNLDMSEIRYIKEPLSKQARLLQFHPFFHNKTCRKKGQVSDAQSMRQSGYHSLFYTLDPN